VLGILAAVAIPAFVDYTHKSRKSEAAVQLNKLMKNLKVAYITNAQFPKGRSGPTPAQSCCGQPSNKCAVTQDWMNDPVWSALDFQIDEPNLFQYSYESDGKTVHVTAVGDLDCDGVAATYTLDMASENGNPTSKITEPPAGAQ